MPIALAGRMSACQTAGMALCDLELWAAANQVLTAHGERAPVFIAERIGALALAGDAEGIAAWQAIARRLSEMGIGAAGPAVTH